MFSCEMATVETLTNTMDNLNITTTPVVKQYKTADYTRKAFKVYYEKHKNDPERVVKRNEQAKKYYDEHKDDEAFMEKKRLNRSRVYERKKLEQQQENRIIRQQHYEKMFREHGYTPGVATVLTPPNEEQQQQQ